MLFPGFRTSHLVQNISAKTVILHFLIIPRWNKSKSMLTLLNNFEDDFIFYYLLIIPLKDYFSKDFIYWLFKYKNFKICSHEKLIFFFSDRFFYICKSFLIRDLEIYLKRKFRVEWIFFSKRKKAFLRRYQLKIFIDYEKFIFFISTSQQAFFLNKILRTVLKLKGFQNFSSNFLITKTAESFTFRNWKFQRQKRGLFFCKIAKSSLLKYRNDLKFLIKNILKVEDLVVLLNSKIRSWIFYNKNCSQVLSTYASLDYYLFRCLMKRFKKSHPNKSKYWIFKKYWRWYNNKMVFVVSRKKNILLLVSHLEFYRKLTQMSVSFKLLT